ncbi:MAG: stage II sporulation protein M [Vampirovibrio sp.]|nr:stage II sporulation protein M [Vampirovibrio sp.]
MNYKRWVLEREPEWAKLESLLKDSQESIRQLAPVDIREMALTYRAVIRDLARAKSTPECQHLVPYLNNLAHRLHGRVFEAPATRWQDVWRFFAAEFPQSFRKNSGFISAAFATFLMGAVMAAVTLVLDPNTHGYFVRDEMMTIIRSGKLWVDNIQASAAESGFLMTNNINVAFKAYVYGMVFGLGTLFVMFFNGMFALGGPLTVCFQYGVGHQLLLFVAPHGVIELTTIFIAGGAGMMVGWALLFPGDLLRWMAVRRRATESLRLIAGCVPLLVVAGLIEGLVSLNKEVPAEGRVLISVVSAIILFAYLGFAGRNNVESVSLS